jgi:hypothetical protein
MDKIEKRVLKAIAKSIKELDKANYNESTVLTGENVRRQMFARNKLINIIFDCGYELEHVTYRLIKSTHKRPLFNEKENSIAKAKL